jgi:hypothetical protein
MELQKLKNLSDLIGKGTEIKKNTKTIKKEEEKFFMELLDNMCQIEAVSAILNTVGIHISKHENPLINSLKILMEKHFGPIKTEIILWWVFDSIGPEGEVYPLLDENNVKHIINTPLQLYKFLKQYDGK